MLVEVDTETVASKSQYAICYRVILTLSTLIALVEEGISLKRDKTEGVLVVYGGGGGGGGGGTEVNACFIDMTVVPAIRSKYL